MEAERSVEPIGTNMTCGLAYFSDFASRRLASRSGSQLSFTPNLPLFAGDHGGAVIPVPIPNTEVKGSIAEGSASPGRARVGRRQLFLFLGSPTRSTTPRPGTFRCLLAARRRTPQSRPARRRTRWGLSKPRRIRGRSSSSTRRSRRPSSTVRTSPTCAARAPRRYSSTTALPDAYSPHMAEWMSPSSAYSAYFLVALQFCFLI